MAEENNVKAMHEALEALNRIDTRGLKRLLSELVESDIFDGGQINKTISAVDKAKSALAKAKLRQCDIGTAEEQYQRYAKFCCSHYRIANNDGGNCLKCPFTQPICKLQWAQMPYKESEAGE